MIKSEIFENLMLPLKGSLTDESWNFLLSRGQMFIEQTLTKNEGKPIVNGSLLLHELMQIASIKNEDGMPIVEYLDKPNGGSVAYLRHDAVVKKLNSMLEM